MIIRREQDWPQVYARLDQYRKVGAVPFPDSGVEVRWGPAKVDRSLDQNALSHAWYAQVAREEKEYTPEQVKCLCKYAYGVPILRADDSEFNQWCVLAIDPLPYESRIKSMRYVAVTSEMTKKQMSEYLEAVQRHYAGRVRLEFPDE